jgi:lactoylglutathione lyase
MPDSTFSLGWVIVYVDAPPETAAFYERTFGLTVEFVVPGGSYAQLDTGPTKLAFASYELGEKNFAGGVRRAAGGCSALATPQDKPQGQRVAYVRDPFGTLVELATPLEAAEAI